MQELHKKHIDDMTKKWLFQTPSRPRIQIFQARRISKAPQKERERERGYQQTLITLTLSLNYTLKTGKRHSSKNFHEEKPLCPLITQYQSSVPSLATDRELTSSQTDLQRTSNCMVQTRKVSGGYTRKSQTLRLKGYKHLPRRTVNKLVYCVTKFPQNQNVKNGNRKVKIKTEKLNGEVKIKTLKTKTEK